ncbi:ABC transporter permease [Orbus sturtevantii]|uniref:ABC transporter permease n=1 Tax=Orbus sturtevantii TaxID=3074109 RepID=UPI00370D4EBD
MKTLHRMLALIKKELILLLQEKPTRIILMMPVLIQIILFPFAASLNVTNATIAVYRTAIDPISTAIIDRISHADSFSQTLILQSADEIKETINNQNALLVIRFADDFAKKQLTAEIAKIQLILDGRHSNSAQIAANYIQQIVSQYQAEMQCNNQQICAQNQLVVRHWFNPNLDYKWFVLPSLVALITTIGVLIVTSLSVAREREQGTLDQLRVSPLNTGQIFVGKAVPAVIIATLQGTIVLLAGILLYNIPFQGSLIYYYICILCYGLSLVGFGLFISAISASQQQAFIGIMVFMIPAILLSGYIAPVENMPQFLQHLTWLNPVMHFNDLTKQIYLKNVNFIIIWQNLWPLLVITVITTTSAYYLFKKKLD